MKFFPLHAGVAESLRAEAAPLGFSLPEPIAQARPGPKLHEFVPMERSLGVVIPEPIAAAQSRLHIA